MSGFADVLANGIALANTLTGSLQCVVQHYMWQGQNGFNANDYAAPVGRNAILQRTQKATKDSAGNDVIATHIITILELFEGPAIAGRDNPIDVRDRFIAPDGSTGAILSVDTVVNPVTGKGYYQMVTLGKRST